jgi:hypothetical protein
VDRSANQKDQRRRKRASVSQQAVGAEAFDHENLEQHKPKARARNQHRAGKKDPPGLPMFERRHFGHQPEGRQENRRINRDRDGADRDSKPG